MDPAAQGVEISQDHQQPKSAFAAYWYRIGGGSLAVSLILHSILIVAALFLIFQTPKLSGLENVDFLPGGGGGTEGNTKVNQQKRKMMVNRSPSMRIASQSNSGIALPDTNTQLTSVSTLTQTYGAMTGTPGSGGGFGGGKGTGVGTGMGAGFGPGNSPGFTAKFLGLATMGNNIIFCIDTSGSMKSNLGMEGIDVLKRELMKAIDSLPPTAMFNLICFGHKADVFKKDSVLATTEAKAEAKKYMDWYYKVGRTRTEANPGASQDDDGTSFIPVEPNSVKELKGTSGGSRVDLAMVAAFSRKPSTIFVLSDGAPGTKKTEDNEPMSREAIVKLIYEKYNQMLRGPKVAVNTITVDSSSADGKAGEAFMKALSEKLGGKHKTVPVKDLK